jgi:hypothetical protein
MEQENNTQEENKKHMCKTGSCCDGCCDCHCHKGGMNKRYWAGRWLSLLIGVLLAFWVGVKLGEIKGYMYASFGPRMHQGWMMRTDRDVLIPAELPTPTPENQ